MPRLTSPPPSSVLAQKRKLDAEAAARAAARASGRAGGAAAEDAQLAAAGVRGGAKGQVGALFRQQAAAVTAVPWQLLQLAETPVPGRFKVRLRGCTCASVSQTLDMQPW